MDSSRRLFTLLLCGALVLSKLGGTHMHMEHLDQTESAHEHALVVATAFDAGHALAHGDSDSVDVSATQHGSGGKIPLLSALALLCAAVAMFAAFRTSRHLPLANYRAPTWLGRPDCLPPPSQAPPLPV